MFAWLASLFVLFLHGNSARVTPSHQTHSTGLGTAHAMDTSSATVSSSSPAVVDGSTQP
jgi:hypothetical protein